MSRKHNVQFAIACAKGLESANSANTIGDTLVYSKESREYRAFTKENCRRNIRGKEPDLGSLVVYAIEDGLKRRLVETSFDPLGFIILKAGA